MSETVAIPRNTAQWLLETIDVGGAMKARLFMAMGNVHLGQDDARMLKDICLEKFDGSGADEETAQRLETLIGQLVAR
jgi:hypothetical protein